MSAEKTPLDLLREVITRLLNKNPLPFRAPESTFSLFLNGAIGVAVTDLGYTREQFLTKASEIWDLRLAAQEKEEP
jgi:hypothetical protein